MSLESEMTREEIEFIKRVAVAIFTTVKEAGPLGAPESMVCLALTSMGAKPGDATKFINAMVEAGKLKRDAHVLRVA
jgi:hypothetical protein